MTAILRPTRTDIPALMRLDRGEGFAEEGLLRDRSRGPDGRHRSMVVMSMPRPEWQARQPNRSMR